MTRYQICRPCYLEDIINDMAVQGWRTLKIWGGLEQSTEKEFLIFRKAICKVMETIPRTNLKYFLFELTSKSILSIENILNHEREDEASTMLRTVFRLVLEQYPYIEPVYGTVKVLPHSELVQL